MVVDESHVFHMEPDDSRVVPMMEPPMTQEEEWIEEAKSRIKDFDASRDLLVVPSSIKDSLSGVRIIDLPDVRNVSKVRVGYR